VAKSSNKGAGWWAFVIGLVVAVIAGFTGNLGAWTWLLALLGLVVGYLNVQEKEAVTFLVASVALMLAGSANLETLWAPLAPILAGVVVFVAPAAIIVAIKAVYETAK